MQPRLKKDFVVVMIDTDRMTSGAELAQRLRKSETGGIPWTAILNAEGTPLVTSDGPEGNCGCPVDAHEIDHFLTMIDTTRQHMSDHDRLVIERELRAHGSALQSARGKSPGQRDYLAAVGLVKDGQFVDAIAALTEACENGFAAHRLTQDPAIRQLRHDPDRRPELFALLEESVRASEIEMVDRLEPGRRIRLRGQVVDMATGAPISGALMKLFQTNAAGEYRPGMDAGGGAGNPRLFGYLRTDDDGRFTVDTIMPERYPQSSVPRHVHYHVWAEGYPKLVSECFFDSDPNLTDRTRRSAPASNFPIVVLESDDQGRAIGKLLVRVPTN